MVSKLLLVQRARRWLSLGNAFTMGKVKYSALFLFLCLQNSYVINAKKDGNEIPESGETTRKFRSGQVNQVWEKAIKMKLSGVTMTDLFGDLKHHDLLVMEHKRTKAKPEDNDGLRDAELTEKLHEIMEKYGLVRKVKPTSEGRSEGKLRNRFLEDPKLDKLWQTANKHGKFSENELEALELEFNHHRRKVEEHQALRSDISKFDELSDNAVEKQLSLEENTAKKEKLTHLQEDIEEGFERLNLKTKQGTLSADSVPFTEPRVAKLWEEAKKGNFTEEELESIKEELQHFQTRIQKHLFFRDQLKNTADKIEFHGGQESSPQQQRDTQNHLQNKVQDLAAKVKKLHHELTQKLSSGSKVRKEL